MSVVLEAGAIVLQGTCGVEEAETLLGLIQQNPGVSVDLSKAGHLHTALWQVIMALQPTVQGKPADDFAHDWLMPTLQSAATA